MESLAIPGSLVDKGNVESKASMANSAPDFENVGSIVDGDYISGFDEFEDECYDWMGSNGPAFVG
jgi:hypothetical protein